MFVSQNSVAPHKNSACSCSIHFFCLIFSSGLRISQWPLALHLISFMPSSRLQGDQVTQNSGITAVKAGSWQMALRLFGFSGDVISYGAATSACDRGARWQQAMYLKDLACGVAQSAKSLSYFATSCLGASARLGEWEQSVEILKQLRMYSCELNVMSCSALCTDGRRWQLAYDVAAGCGNSAPLLLDMTFFCELLGAMQWAKSLLLMNQGLQIVDARSSGAVSAVMGSCQRWEQWKECLLLLLEQQLRRIEANLNTFSMPALALAGQSKWEGVSHLLQSVRKQRLEIEGGIFSAAVFSADWTRSISQLQSMKGQLQNQDLKLLAPYAETQWSLVSLLLAQLEDLRLQTSELRFSVASAMSKKGMWVESLVISQDLWQLGLSSRHLELNSFSTALQWPRALAALEDRLLDYDVLVMACWKCEENRLARQLLKESKLLRSPVSFLWGLSVLHEADPLVIHAACVEAWMVMKNGASDYDLITAWRSMATLGASNQQFHHFVAQEVIDRLSKFTLEELSFVLQAATGDPFGASMKLCLKVQDRAVQLLEDRTNLCFAGDGQEFLSIVFASKIAGQAGQ